MVKKIFHTTDMSLTAALSTIKGASIGHVTVTPKRRRWLSSYIRNCI